MPADANAAGDIFGGWVMAQMDLACGIRAAERAHGRVVTAAVKEMAFALPVKETPAMADDKQLRELHIRLRAAEPAIKV